MGIMLVHPCIENFYAKGRECLGERILCKVTQWRKGEGNLLAIPLMGSKILPTHLSRCPAILFLLGALAPWLTEVTLVRAALGSIVVALITRETKQMFRWTEIKLLILAVIQQLSQPNSYSTIRCKQTKKRVNESKKKKSMEREEMKGR